MLRDDTIQETSRSYWSASLEEEMEPSTAPWKHQQAEKWQYRNVNRNNVISDFSCLCSKLNNTEAKLTGVPPHCFVIVIVKPWAWYIVAALIIFY